MKSKSIPFELSDKGQTAVEYILLFSVVIVMSISIMKYVKTRVLGDPENCEGAAESSITCQVHGVFNSYKGSYAKFRYFRIL
ncbi:MAG: class III signal peptide-containing protein [Bacteriovoracaceae bacterium]|nr:class III signal peptide-containing protein [Bacteriovoracaceae bacterium]